VTSFPPGPSDVMTVNDQLRNTYKTEVVIKLTLNRKPFST